MNAHTRLKLTKAEFRRWVEERPEHERYELVDGEPRMMVRVKNAHDSIVVNWIVALRARIDTSRYAVHTGEYALSTNDRSYRLPDVSLGPIQSDRLAHDMVEPLLLVEVLSPSTAYADMNEKLAEYLAMPTLLAYAVCAQDSRRVWLWRRDANGWPARPAELFRAEDAVEIPSLALTIPLADLYFGLKVDNE